MKNKDVIQIGAHDSRKKNLLWCVIIRLNNEFKNLLLTSHRLASITCKKLILGNEELVDHVKKKLPSSH